MNSFQVVLCFHVGITCFYERSRVTVNVSFSVYQLLFAVHNQFISVNDVFIIIFPYEISKCTLQCHGYKLTPCCDDKKTVLGTTGHIILLCHVGMLEWTD